MEIDRRGFLKFGSRLLLGAAAGAVHAPISVGAEKIVEKAGFEAGNASVKSYLEKKCGPNADMEACIDELNQSGSSVENVLGTSRAALFEEVLFRGLPSVALNIADSNLPANSMANFMLGEDGLGLTKSEVVVGIGSAVLFGAAHNMTSEGFNKKTIPVAQTLGGLSMWYLQRKIGFGSNVVAHTTHNLIL